MPILEILDCMIMNWKPPKNGKKGDFNRKVIISLIQCSKTTWRAKLKFGHNMGANDGFMHTEFVYQFWES